jgi:hypothetical protein
MAMATVTSNDEMMMTMPHAALIIGGFTAAIADATSKATKASGVLRVQRLCVGWRSYGDYHQVVGWCFTTVAQKAQTINLRLKVAWRCL